MFVQDGQQYGDEYLAELDYIEVVERTKEGYESDVNEDEGIASEKDSDEDYKEAGSDRYEAIFYAYTVQITFIFIDFRVCDFAFAFKTQNAPCVSRFKRVLFSDRFQFAF